MLVPRACGAALPAPNGTGDLARQRQPYILVWGGPEVTQLSSADNPPMFLDLQWIGTENGIATLTTSSRNLSNCAALANGTLVAMNLWCGWAANGR